MSDWPEGVTPHPAAHPMRKKVYPCYWKDRKYRFIRIDKRTIALHRYVMEMFLERSLGAHEQVHHINGNPSDNRISNLQVLTAAEHGHLHYAQLKATRKKLKP